MTSSPDFQRLRNWIYSEFPPAQRTLEPYTLPELESDLKGRIPSFNNWDQEDKDALMDVVKDAQDYNTKPGWKKVSGWKKALTDAKEWIKDKFSKLRFW